MDTSEDEERDTLQLIAEADTVTQGFNVCVVSILLRVAGNQPGAEAIDFRLRQ